jgi:KDO2-lipid IV(A) lauroyltransferase
VRRKIILENLCQAFPLMPYQERVELGQAACSHLIRVFFEFLRIPHYLENGLNGLVHIEGLEHFKRAKKQGRGILLVTGHLGSFELALAALATTLGPLSVIVKAFPNEVDRFINSIRACAGTQVISARGTTITILQRLKRNEVVVAVIDQNAKRDKGTFVEFFGRSTCTMTGAALIAMRSKTAVIGVSSWRRLDGTHMIGIIGELSSEPAGALARRIQHNTQVYTHFIEQAIRAHPEQWLWPHKRFKTRPPGEVTGNR